MIAEGEDAVGRDLTLAEALALVDVARRRGLRHVAVVDDTTGALVDERRARTWVRRGPPPLPGDPLVPCPACEDEGGVPTGDVLVQLPSGTWVRDTCDVCQGRRRVDREVLARHTAQVVEESVGGSRSAVPRIASGTRRRVARVLVIDDEPRMVEALRLLLADEFDVRGTTDPWLALVWLTRGDWFDVVLCDVTMPGLSGVDLRNRVHATAPEMAGRIVFVTGGIVHERVRRSVESVPNLCLEKPVDVPALRELIHRRTSPVADDEETPLIERRSG